MKLSFLLLPVLALPASAASRPSAGFTFELPSLQAFVQKAGPASLGELLDEFAAADRARQREILEELSLRTGGSAWADQSRLVWTLRDAARSTQTPSEIRAKALQALGKCARQMDLASAAKEAGEVLIEEAKRDGLDDAGLRPYALIGLNELAGKLPFYDLTFHENLVEALLDARQARRSQLETTLALKALSAHFSAYGASYLWTKLGRRIDDELVRAFENGGLESVYSDSTVSVEGRYFWARCLWSLAWLQVPGESDMRQRCGKALRDISNREPDSSLRVITRAYAERLNA